MNGDLDNLQVDQEDQANREGQEADQSNSSDLQSAGSLARRGPTSRSIARMSTTRALTARQLDQRRIIHHDSKLRKEIDAFRELRTQLLAFGGRDNFVTLVTAVSHRSGASFVTRNLAAAFALDEARTALIIDCNTTHSSQAQAFGLDPDAEGLIDYLERPSIGVEHVLCDTGIPRLRLIPSGKPCEMGGEYFSSFRMRAVLDSVRCRYADRYLFLDGPATKGSPDARILSELADVIVLVAGYGRDTTASINQAASNFDPDKFAGVVFNHVP